MFSSKTLISFREILYDMGVSKLSAKVFGFFLIENYIFTKMFLILVWQTLSPAALVKSGKDCQNACVPCGKKCV